jgi:8-oxo-dGTP pyrophosphatase MutT (NUDIX family)
MTLAGEHATLIFRRSYGHDRLYLALHFAKKKERLWRFPGGKLEQGETPEQAAVREAKEELNVTVTKLRKVKEIVTVADGGTWKGHWFVVEGFEGKIKVMEPEKHDAARYMTRDVLLQNMGSDAPELEAVDEI